MRAPDIKPPIAKQRFDASDPAMEMYARKVPWATFSGAHWREIESFLATVGVDLDTATVVDPFDGPHVWGWKDWDDSWGDYVPEPVPLCRVLQQWAWATALYRGGKVSTPKQYAETLQKEVNALEQVLAVINPNNVGPGLPPNDIAAARRRRRTSLRADIMLEITEREQYIAKLEAAGSSSKNNARTEAADYWGMLAQKWLEITKGRAIKYRRQHLIRFLHACSQPLLPMLIKPEKLDGTLKEFVANFFSPRKK